MAANQTGQDYVAAVQPVATTTTLGTSGTPAAAGATVTLTATVTGNAPTGNVSFTEGGNPLPGCAVPVALAGTGNSRTATCGTSSLAVGTHNIVASYGGDPGNLASVSAPLVQVINPAATAAASFVGTDLVTQGNWKAHYGADGYAVLGDSDQLSGVCDGGRRRARAITRGPRRPDRSARAAAGCGGGADCGAWFRDQSSTWTSI